MNENPNINKIFVCPQNNCNNIPEISYIYESMNPIIVYKCNSENHGFIKEEMKLDEFFQKSKLTILCSLCNKPITNNEFIYSKNTHKFFHLECPNDFGFSIENDYIKINSNYLFNNCLIHNSKFIFYCVE